MLRRHSWIFISILAALSLFFAVCFGTGCSSPYRGKYTYNAALVSEVFFVWVDPDGTVEKLESLIVKNKSKISRKHKGNAYKYEELPVLPAGEVEEEEYEIVRKKVFNLEPQTVDDAILEMNMLDHSFFMFKDVVTGEINVVYKRKDGKYGLLLPE